MSRTFEWGEISRLLVVRLDNAGDVVMLSPALRSLRAAAPEAEIALLASPAGARAAELLPEVGEVIEHRASWQELPSTSGQATQPATELALISRLSEARFDAAIVFTSFSQDPAAAAYACYLAGIRRRAGWAALFSGAVLTHPVEPPDPAGHQALRNVQLLRALGAPACPTHLEVQVPAPAARAAEERLRREDLRPHGYVALLPGASAPARRYPPERFGEAARRLWLDHGLPSLLIGSERDRQLAERIIPVAGTAAHSVVGETDLPTAAALIERASLVLSNDSLGMHLADALGVPLVAAFSGTDLESQWAPRSTRGRLFRQPTLCAPCYRIDCPVGLRCLDVPPAALAATGGELARTPSGSVGSAREPDAPLRMPVRTNR